MPYKNSLILNAIYGKGEFKNDPLSIVPLFEKPEDLLNSGAASVDMRLGRWFITLKHTRHPYLDISRSPREGDGGGGAVADPKGGGTKRPTPERGPTESELSSRHFVRFDEKFILHPQSFVLGATLEWVKIPSRCVGTIVGKSSFGRRGLIVETAPVVHPGFSGTLTLELANVGEVPIALRPGMKIAQLLLDNATGTGTAKGSFEGNRRPTLGQTKLDEIAELMQYAR